MSTHIRPGTTRALGVTPRTTVVAAAMVVGLVGGGALVLRSTDAAFTDTAVNGPNTWEVASVQLDTDLAATVMFDAAVDGSLVPGQTLTRCIEVQYAGDRAAPVELYSSSFTDSGTTPTLGSTLTLKIEEGTGTAGVNCAGWTAATATVFDGTMAGFNTAHNSFATGAGSWTTGAAPENKLYKFTVTLPSNASTNLQAATLSASFTWEAQLGS